MNGVHARFVLSKKKRQFLRNQRQGCVHGKERVFAYQEIYNTVHGLNAQLIKINGTYETQAGGRRNALQRDLSLTSV